MRALTTITTLSLAVSLSLSGCSTPPAMAEGDGLGPGPYDPIIAKFVELELTREHVSPKKIDDEVSKAWFDNYLEDLDPQRWYFLRSDVEEFRAAWSKKLDNDLAGEVKYEAAFAIFERYQTRVTERLAAARDLVDDPVDFTVNESLEDREDAEWPQDEAAARDLWRKYIKNELIAARINKEEDTAVIEKLRKRWDRFERVLMEAESEDVRERYLNALTTTFDPHTNYMKPANNDDFQIELTNKLEGIGAVLRDVDGYTTISEIVAGGPADLSDALGPNDKIVAVAQGDQPPVDVVDLQLDKVVQLIRGPKGTEVRLTIVPAGAETAERKVVSIQRDTVEIKESAAKSKLVEVDQGGVKRKLGVILLKKFYTRDNRGEGLDSSNDVRKALEDLKAQGAEGVILDLRENGGGSLTEAIEISGLFIDQGPMVQVGTPAGDREIMPDTEPGTAWDGPLVVLTSPLSASASEIVAAAIQDYGRGLVVGAKSTHGKGTVQSIIPLDQLLQRRVGRALREPVAGALKLTIQKFYRVTGDSTQYQGVRSDIVLPTWWDFEGVYEADLPHALESDTIAAVPFQQVGDPKAAVPELAKKSAARVAANEEFQKFQAQIKLRDELTARESTTLVLADRQAEADQWEKMFGEDKKDDVEPPTRLGGDDPEEDPILDEALQILGDYVGLAS